MAASRSSQFHGYRRERTGPVRLSCRVNSRIGSAISSSKRGIGRPGCAHASPCSILCRASCAEAMLPPETDVIVLARVSRPSSFRRRSAPRWKRVARYPPPESASPTPRRASFGRGRYREIP